MTATGGGNAAATPRQQASHEAVTAAEAAPAGPSCAQAPASPPVWLLTDLIEVAQSSSVSSAHLVSEDMVKQKVAICCKEDTTALLYGKEKEHMLPAGIYEARVVEVFSATSFWCLSQRLRHMQQQRSSRLHCKS